MNYGIYLIIGSDERYLGTVDEFIGGGDLPMRELSDAIRLAVDELLFGESTSDSTSIEIQLR